MHDLYICAYMYVCMYVCMHVCMYVSLFMAYIHSQVMLFRLDSSQVMLLRHHPRGPGRSLPGAARRNLRLRESAYCSSVCCFLLLVGPTDVARARGSSKHGGYP